MSYQTYVNPERTVMVNIWAGGRTSYVQSLTVALRDSPDEIWGPPIVLRQEQQSYELDPDCKDGGVTFPRNLREFHRRVLE